MDQADVLSQLGTDRSADVLEEMDPDDAADLLGVLNPTDAEMLLTRMDPDDSAPVRRLLTHSPDTAGGLMTSDPVVLTPDTTVAEALARVRDPDLTAALSSMVFVARPPTATPTGRYLGCVPLQRLLREAPAELVGGIVDSDLLTLTPETPLGSVTRYFAAYNLVCGPVLDDQNHLLGAVTVDDLLDHLLPHDWRVDVQQLDVPGRIETTGRIRHEQIHGTATAVHPADIARVFAAARPRGRRAVHRVHRALLRHRPLPADSDHPGAGVDRPERVRGPLRWDPYPFILLNLAFSTQAAYAAPLILLAQNRQENRDRVALDEDRRRAAQTKADTEYLARELAALRLAVGEVVDP